MLITRATFLGALNRYQEGLGQHRRYMQKCGDLHAIQNQKMLGKTLRRI
jgi:hypothetical protein